MSNKLSGSNKVAKRCSGNSHDLGNSQLYVPEPQDSLAKILLEDTSFNDFRIEYEFPTIGNLVMFLNGRRVYSEISNSKLILLAIDDITEQEKIEKKHKSGY